MNIHEYQAKDLFEKFSVPSPKGRMAESPEEAKKIAEEINGQTVIKAQVHAGGEERGPLKMDLKEECTYLMTLKKFIVLPQKCLVKPWSLTKRVKKAN